MSLFNNTQDRKLEDMMNKTLMATTLLSALASTAVYADSTSEDVAALQQQVDSLSSLIANLSKNTIHVSGFASGAFAVANNDAGYAGYTTDGSYHEDSLFGVQATFKPSKSLEATIQLVAKGELDWKPKVTAAYLGYTFDNDVKLRVGKLRLPLFMLSDYLDLGYAQPWARSPEEVYGRVPISSFTGVDASYEMELDDSYINLQAFTGNEKMSDESSAGGAGNVEDIVGLVTTWNDDYWTVRASYTIATVKDVEFPIVGIDANNGKPITALPNIESESGSYASFGVRYENENWLVMGEATQTRVDGYFSDSNAGYVTVGYHLNQVMPYVSVARLETVDNEERESLNQAAQSLTYQRNAYSVGTRWDIQPGLAMKFDVTYANNFGDTNGGLDPKSTEDSTTVFTIKVDATF
ncbi:hypothetical protein [Moritella marina]|uniref:hypothetical protein n=1 Tax=Moritella marina TaxID=90736 RepID=UPI003703DE6E